MVSFFLNEDLPNAQLFKIALHYHKKKDYRRQKFTKGQMHQLRERNIIYYEHCSTALYCSSLGCEGGLIFGGRVGYRDLKACAAMSLLAGARTLLKNNHVLIWKHTKEI